MENRIENVESLKDEMTREFMFNKNVTLTDVLKVIDKRIELENFERDNLEKIH